MIGKYNTGEDVLYLAVYWGDGCILLEEGGLFVKQVQDQCVVAWHFGREVCPESICSSTVGRC